MEKATWLKRTNALLFVFLLCQALTGGLAGVIDPEVFEVIHPVGGTLLVIAAIVHIGLNWGWVRAAYVRRKRSVRT
jgi:hypothetical protein